jgi:hypothetical protein
MVSLVFTVVAFLVVVAFFIGGLKFGLMCAALFIAGGLLFCAPWIAMGDY